MVLVLNELLVNSVSLDTLGAEPIDGVRNSSIVEGGERPYLRESN